MVSDGSVSIELIVAIVAASGTVLAAVIPYILTKRNELKIELKKSQHSLYNELIVALSDFIDKRSIVSANALNMAYNRSTSYAKTEVLEKCKEFLIQMELATKERHDARKRKTKVKTIEESLREKSDLVGEVFKAIRKDINPKEKYFDCRVFFGENI
jgi:hypothetical protein